MCATNRRFLLHWNVRTPHCQRRVLYPCKDSEELEYDEVIYRSFSQSLIGRIHPEFEEATLCGKIMDILLKDHLHLPPLLLLFLKQEICL